MTFSVYADTLLLALIGLLSLPWERMALRREAPARPAPGSPDPQRCRPYRRGPEQLLSPAALRALLGDTGPEARATFDGEGKSPLTRGRAMTREEFTQQLERELRLRGVGFHRASLAEYVEASWPRIADDPDLGRWARQFVDSGNVTLTALRVSHTPKGFVVQHEVTWDDDTCTVSGLPGLSLHYSREANGDARFELVGRDGFVVTMSLDDLRALAAPDGVSPTADGKPVALTEEDEWTLSLRNRQGIDPGRGLALAALAQAGVERHLNGLQAIVQRLP
jgi:hypothetical protein